MPESLREQLAPNIHPWRAAAGGPVAGLKGFKVLGHQTGHATALMNDDIYDVGRNFIYTEVGSGATKGVVQAPTSTLPSVLQFTTGATQHNNQQIQWGKGQTASTTSAGTSTAFAPFLIKASAVPGDGGNSIHLRCRMLISTTIANAAFFVGLSSVSTTLFSASAPNVNDMVGFYKAAGAATVAGVEIAGGVTTTTVLNTNTLVANTWYTFEFLIRERLSTTWWINGNSTGDATGTSVLPANTVALSPSFVVSAGTAAAATAQVQGFFCGQDGGF